MAAEDGTSLRRGLLAWLLLPLAALVPLAALLVYELSLAPALDGLDRALTDTVVALSRILVVRDGQPELPLTEQTAQALRADLLDEIFFAVGDGRGRMLDGDAELLPLAPELPAGEWRFFDARLHGQVVRVAAYGAHCGAGATGRACPVIVAESLRKRAAAARAVLLAALAAAAVLALSLALLATVAVSRALRPLHRAADQVASRSLNNLAPIDSAGMPREVHSFVRALNLLFARLREAASRQRAFVADAAHQLRTPLATIRSDAAQALAAPHPEALTPLLSRLHAAAERGSRLAQQLLAMARVEGAALAADAPHDVDLRALATEAAQDWLPRSLAAGQDLGFELSPASVRGDALLLRELLANLLHNAVEHAGPGVRVTVRTGRDASGAWLEVEDEGPGIPADEQARVWERFGRGSGARGAGSGLGLAIVHDIAAVHGAGASLGAGAGGRGLKVRVVFPDPPAAHSDSSAASG